MQASVSELVRSGATPDEEIVRRVREGETALFEVLMRRHNPRVYRAVRGILRDEDEVEEAMQQAYIAAYTHLSQFNGDARFSTWLLKIAINEALGFLRRKARLALMDAPPESEDTLESQRAAPSPEERAGNRELVTLLESAIDSLPETYRVVVMLREVEGLSTREAAESLGLTEENVKVRLHRAKEMLREELISRAGTVATEAFQFHARRCDRVVTAVLARLEALRA